MDGENLVFIGVVDEVDVSVHSPGPQWNTVAVSPSTEFSHVDS